MRHGWNIEDVRRRVQHWYSRGSLCMGPISRSAIHGILLWRYGWGGLFTGNKMELCESSRFLSQTVTSAIFFSKQTDSLDCSIIAEFSPGGATNFRKLTLVIHSCSKCLGSFSLKEKVCRFDKILSSISVWYSEQWLSHSWVDLPIEQQTLSNHYFEHDDQPSTPVIGKKKIEILCGICG